MKKAMDANPDQLVIMTLYAECPLIYRALEELQWTPKSIWTLFCMITDSFLQDVVKPSLKQDVRPPCSFNPPHTFTHLLLHPLHLPSPLTLPLPVWAPRLCSCMITDSSLKKPSFRRTPRSTSLLLRPFTFLPSLDWLNLGLVIHSSTIHGPNLFFSSRT